MKTCCNIDVLLLFGAEGGKTVGKTDGKSVEKAVGKGVGSIVGMVVGESVGASRSNDMHVCNICACTLGIKIEKMKMRN